MSAVLNRKAEHLIASKSVFELKNATYSDLVVIAESIQQAKNESNGDEDMDLLISSFRERFDKTLLRYQVDTRNTVHGAMRLITSRLKKFYSTHCGLKKPSFNRTVKWLHWCEVSNSELNDGLLMLYKNIFKRNDSDMSQQEINNALLTLDLIRNKYDK